MAYAISGFNGDGGYSIGSHGMRGESLIAMCVPPRISIARDLIGMARDAGDTDVRMACYRILKAYRLGHGPFKRDLDMMYEFHEMVSE